jgi:hypothetical protein
MTPDLMVRNPKFAIRNKKGSRAAVWHIYLNLVAKGVSLTPLQAIKFPKEKLAHRGALLELPSNRLLAQIFGAITNIAGAMHIILKGSRGVKAAGHLLASRELLENSRLLPGKNPRPGSGSRQDLEGDPCPFRYRRRYWAV